MGKARFPLLEIGIGALEEIVMDGQSESGPRSHQDLAKMHRKRRNHASTSSAGSTLTPPHIISTSIVNIPSTSGAYATAMVATSSSTPTTRSIGSGTGGLQQFHRRHRHHHRSATSSLIVTSTSTTSTAAAGIRTRNPLPLLANLPPPTVVASSLRRRSSSSSNAGRRLRSTTVQSTPREALGPSASTVSAGETVDEESSLHEVVVSGPGAGIDWPEVVATATIAASTTDNEAADVALTAADTETGGEIEEVLVFSEGGRRVRLDRYMPSESSAQISHSPSSSPPPMGENGATINVRSGGSELAGFFHPILFVPPRP